MGAVSFKKCWNHATFMLEEDSIRLTYVGFFFSSEEAMAGKGFTTPVSGDVYDTNHKQILVTRDPVYCHPAIQNGVIVGRQPYDYLPLAIICAVFNPLLGPVAIVFSGE